MLTLKVEEIEKLISTLEWVQIATLSTEEERKSIQGMIEKFIVARKTATRKRIEFVAE